jgi:hypothetical protein
VPPKLREKTAADPVSIPKPRIKTENRMDFAGEIIITKNIIPAIISMASCF